MVAGANGDSSPNVILHVEWVTRYENVNVTIPHQVMEGLIAVEHLKNIKSVK